MSSPVRWGLNTTKRAVFFTALVFIAANFPSAASTLEISHATTGAAAVTSPAGDRTIQLRFGAELAGPSRADFANDVLVEWEEVGGIDPEPFRVVIPAGCFVPTRRGFRMEDFEACGAEMIVISNEGKVIPLTIVDLDARVVRRDDGSSRFEIFANFYPPDPIYPPDPVRAFLGIVGGAAVKIAVGSDAGVAPPNRAETVAGIDPQPF